MGHFYAPEMFVAGFRQATSLDLVQWPLCLTTSHPARAQPRHKGTIGPKNPGHSVDRIFRDGGVTGPNPVICTELAL